MDRKNAKKYFNAINEPDLKNIFRNFEKIKSINVNGFSGNNIEKIPKKIFISQFLLKSVKKIDPLIVAIKKYYSELIDNEKYENLPFEEAKNNINKGNIIPVIAYYLLHSEPDVKVEIDKFIASEQFDNIINESAEEISVTNDVEKVEKTDREIIMELDTEINKLNNSIKELKNKNGILAKENNENKVLIKQFKQQKKEAKGDVTQLNTEIEELNISYIKEQEKNVELNKQLEETKQKLELMINDHKNEIEKHKIGVLQDVELNVDRADIYIVSNNHADELISRFEKFEKIYILERSVSEDVRRKLKIKEIESKRKVLEIINDNKTIKKIIEGKIM